MVERHFSYPEILNSAVKLSLEWGEEWLQPINSRIRAMYPYLSSADAAELNAACKKIQQFSWAFFQDPEKWQLTMSNAVTKVIPMIKMQYPLLNDDNISRLVNQGMYYSLK